MSVRAIPTVSLEPDHELTAEQIVQAANGKLRIVIDGEKSGFSLPVNQRVLFTAAITLGYLKHTKKQARLAEVFACWCDAKEVPCVSFEIEDDCVDMMSTEDPAEQDDPIVTLHFDTSTSSRPFSKKGLVTVAEFLLENLWDVRLSPWKISGGVVRLSLARQLMEDLHTIWSRTSELNAEAGIPPDYESNPFGPQMIH